MRRSIDSAASPRFAYRTLTALILTAIWFVTNGPKALAGINAWTSIGPEDGYVSALALDPTTPGTLYAHTVYCQPAVGCLGGVFKSTDGGGTWTAIGSGPETFVDALALDPTAPGRLYSRTVYCQPTIDCLGALFRSTDGARTWSAANAGLTDTTVSALALDPSTPDLLYAGTGSCDCNRESCSGGVFKSMDGGDTWGAANTGLPGIRVAGLAIDPTTPSTLYARGAVGCYKFGTANGVFKSTDSAGSWVAVNVGLDPYTEVNALAITPTTLYAGTGACFIFGSCAGGVFMSTDGAGSWTAVEAVLPSEPVSALTVDPSKTATVYVAMHAGVLKSTDGASTWAALNTGLSSPVADLVIDPATPSTLYALSTFSGGELFKIEQVCVGDCHGSGQVTVDELVTLVDIALGNSAMSLCASGDVNHDGQVTVDEIMMAVNLALDGCT